MKDYPKICEIIDENTAWDGNEIIPVDDIPDTDDVAIDSVARFLERQRDKKMHDLEARKRNLESQAEELGKRMDECDDKNNYYDKDQAHSELLGVLSEIERIEDELQDIEASQD